MRRHVSGYSRGMKLTGDHAPSSGENYFDEAGVTKWFRANVADVEPPLSFDLIAAGRSNLTFRVADAAGTEWALRRPPTGHLLSTAHDMHREHRIIAALGGTDVPVPPTIGYCDDPAVCPAPFFVMAFVAGNVLRDVDTACELSPAQRALAGDDLIDTLVTIHVVDPDDVGLGDLGRRKGYIERQLTRWYGQFEMSRMGRDVPLIDELHTCLRARIPEQRAATIVHGDYRLDNVIVGSDGRIVAVLDWEICTLGDPLADLGLLMVYWAEEGDPIGEIVGAATRAPGFPSRTALAERYARGSGRDLSELGFYVAFGYWKLACILQGVYRRYVSGAGGGHALDTADFPLQIETLAGLAVTALRP
jgi:aminoglycoside phosphotransferase (APT) family kinase protein